MPTNHSLTASIQEANFREPDGDGDTRLEGSLLIKSTSDQVLELFITQQVVVGSAGTVLSSSKDEREDSLVAGDELSIDLDSGYLKASSLEGSSKANIEIEILGCTANYAQLPQVLLGDGLPGLYGWNQAVQLGPDLIIETFSVAVKPTDDDGDIRVELRALVRNISDQRIPRFSFKARAVAAGGREIDDSSTDEPLAPGEVKAIEASFYSLKENRMKGLSIATEATAFTIQCLATQTSEVVIAN